MGSCTISSQLSADASLWTAFSSAENIEKNNQEAIPNFQADS
jgi:hypothetical protein